MFGVDTSSIAGPDIFCNCYVWGGRPARSFKLTSNEKKSAAKAFISKSYVHPFILAYRICVRMTFKI